MGTLRETYYIYLRNMRVWLAQPMSTISTVLGAAFIFLFFGAPLDRLPQLPGFPTRDYNAYLTSMALVITVAFSGSDVAWAVLTDILSGYFDKLLLAPINRFSILLGGLFMAGTRAMVQVVVIVLLALALGVSFRGGWMGVVVVVVASSIFGVAWGCLGLIIALKTKNAQVTHNTWLLFLPLAFLTSAFMPKEFLTGWFKVAVSLNPVDYVMAAVRVIIIKGWEWETILPGLWVLLGMTGGLMAVATWLYRRETA